MSTFMPKAETVVSGIFSMQQESPSAVLLQRLLTFSVVSTSPHTHLTATVAIM